MHEPSCGGAGTSDARFGGPAGLLNPVAAATARFARDERGSTAIEYALIGSLIFLVAAGSIRLYVNRMGGVYNQISTAVSQSD
ncbi:Flp pilus assembly protein, pilin Flp [Methylobacterium phyllostachyos]|uniref:Flp pilus assembly protein, pilin Flp n=1 Tax=Methylobacterium phyllostachyos TaxID=582672 RepID=A0A1H0J110_9HYPH|nr:hypothetical protein [Methylobacterium phyllostachyos]SDO37282.1 Flp pilus assembly protein, pilin Flp [Methylobacterium phyllostachyos]